MAKQRRKKKRKRVRERDWEESREQDFSREGWKHQITTGEVTVDHAEQELPADFTPNALVISHSGKWATVKHEGGEKLCLIHEALFEGNTSVLATGDEVLVEPHDEELMVRAVAPRRSKLSRLAKRKEQIVAANIDNLLIVVSAAKPRFKPGVVDRYLIVAQSGGVRPLLAINKTDLVENLPEEALMYEELGLPVFRTAFKEGIGAEEIRPYLEGKRTVLAGQSGVGKSTFVNALDPSLAIDTQEVSRATEKGKHTTTGPRLYELPGDTQLIDTAGVRSLALWNVTPEELHFYFPDVAEIAEGCKFRNCTHTHEPDCAVWAHVESGELSPLRYRSYVRILDDLEQRRPRY